jgi:hypothetical protein
VTVDPSTTWVAGRPVIIWLLRMLGDFVFLRVHVVALFSFQRYISC